MYHRRMLDTTERVLKSERAGALTQTWYIVQGSRGAVQFLLMVPTDKLQIPMMALDFGIHSPQPLYKGQEYAEDCPHVPGGRCYYSGSTSLAERTLRGFQITGDPEDIWTRLEAAYATL